MSKPITFIPMKTDTNTTNSAPDTARHTPGPWHAGMAAIDAAVYGPKGEHIATLPDLLERDETLANLRLVMAAPELLEALKAIETMAGDYSIDSEKQRALKAGHIAMLARAAIAKATGTEGGR